MWLTLDADADGGGTEQLLLRLEAVAQYVVSLQRVLLAEGIDGISGALKIARHVEEALGDFSADQIARVREQLRACETRLDTLARRVEDVRSLKQRVAEVS
jgi:hypothetical protein